MKNKVEIYITEDNRVFGKVQNSEYFSQQYWSTEELAKALVSMVTIVAKGLLNEK